MRGLCFLFAVFLMLWRSADIYHIGFHLLDEFLYVYLYIVGNSVC